MTAGYSCKIACVIQAIMPCKKSHYRRGARSACGGGPGPAAVPGTTAATGPAEVLVRVGAMSHPAPGT